MNSMDKFLSFLTELENNKIHYNLEHNRLEAVMVNVAIPGERWEVEFFADGHVEVEIFKSGGSNSGLESEEALSRLLEENSN